MSSLAGRSRTLDSKLDLTTRAPIAIAAALGRRVWIQAGAAKLRDPDAAADPRNRRTAGRDGRLASYPGRRENTHIHYLT